MKNLKIGALSIPAAMIIGSLIIGLSIFLTTWVFFGGKGNKQKLFIENPTANKTQPNTITPEQIKKIQEQRAAQMKRPPVATTTSEEE